MTATDTPPEHPDELYTEQAAYLADHTPLTEREAEAYLRRRHAVDDQHSDNYVSNSELADQMGVSDSGFSTHLGNAEEKLDGDDAHIDALTTMLHMTDLGGANGHSRRVIGATKTRNAIVLLSKSDFATGGNLASKYKAHFVYMEPGALVDFDELPDDIIHYDKHSVFTVESNSEQHLVKSVTAYLQQLDAFDHYDLISTVNLIEDELDILVDETSDYASEVVQDASAAIMDAEGQ